MRIWPILTVALQHEGDVIVARQRARRIAALLGFEGQDQTRIATATSEIARNAQTYGKTGKVEFTLQGRREPEALAIKISDQGPGIADPDAILNGQFVSETGLGLGILGARRLMDHLSIDNGVRSGCIVAMGKFLPRGRPPLTAQRLSEISMLLTRETAGDPMSELRAQNQELMQSLQAVEQRRLEASKLSEELERTNKGVVALYAELDRKATELQDLNATLEARVADGVAERERVEQSLRQSQKMEAVGQLTGGIAHDFNNLLMIIGGNLEMLRRRIPPDPVTSRMIDAASQGVARGGSLNQQLLAFARRQDLREEVLSVKDFAPSCLQLIERAVSEDITLRLEADCEDWCCQIDLHQLETAVLNLAINARDAMPSGGLLILATRCRKVEAIEAEAAEVEPGDFVVVSVQDSGSGMTADILEHVFEPFFTTKEVGRGTGLGLSQVYGFAKQSRGFVSIQSVVGRGTQVDIHLPRTEPTAARETAEPAVLVRRRGSARILVVEDDGEVRATTSAMLRELGYTVREADSGLAALEQVSAETPDLVFSDVILAEGMSGLDLANRIVAKHPRLPVLLTSGYTAQRLNFAEEARYRLLRKPYSEARLSEAIETALESIEV